MKTIQKQLILVATLLFVAILNAQEIKNSLLWKIEGKDIKTSYVFGTIHMLPQKDFKIKDKVKKAFMESDIVTLELDMDDPSFMKDIIKYSYLSEGESIRTYMDDNEYALMDNFLQKNLNVSMKQFSKAKPFLLMSSILTTFVGEQLASYELTLINMGKENGKEIKGLETFASQIAAIDSQSYEEQIDGLIDMLKDYENMSDSFKELVDLYKTEDIHALYTKSKVYFNNDLELEEKLLNERNRNWIPEISKLSKTHKVFYAVGAAHLSGEQGILNLLKEKGYKVTPIFD